MEFISSVNASDHGNDLINIFLITEKQMPAVIDLHILLFFFIEFKMDYK
jgi:hypothetical protein